MVCGQLEVWKVLTSRRKRKCLTNHMRISNTMTKHLKRKIFSKWKTAVKDGGCFVSFFAGLYWQRKVHMKKNRHILNFFWTLHRISGDFLSYREVKRLVLISGASRTNREGWNGYMYVLLVLAKQYKKLILTIIGKMIND